MDRSQMFIQEYHNFKYVVSKQIKIFKINKILNKDKHTVEKSNFNHSDQSTPKKKTSLMVAINSTIL